MAKRERWYFTKEELENSPSRRCGMDADKELFNRQQAANLIQDMGQKLRVNQLVINTAIVYMHRFYTFHSFTRFHRNTISSCALFLAAKVEEQHRKLEHVIKVLQICLRGENLDSKSEQFQALASELVHHENLMLRTLGFDLNVQHPHTSVVNCCDLVRANKKLAQASYIMATNTLHLTTMCLRYKPTVVACCCIYFTYKWAECKLPKSVEDRDWWTYVDPNVTREMLEELTGEFITILKNCPSRLKKMLTSNFPKDEKPKIDHPTSPSISINNTNNNNINNNSNNNNNNNNNRSLKPTTNPTFDLQVKNEIEYDPVSMASQKQSVSHLMNFSTPALSSSSSLISKETNSSKSHPNLNSSALIEEKLKPLKESNSHNNSSNNLADKMKSNLSVISSNNRLSNNSTNSNSCNVNSFNDNLFTTDSHMFSDSSEYSDYSAAKKEFPELKMEFSENEDSNTSDLGLNSTFMMNDSNDSKSISNSFEFSQQINHNKINDVKTSQTSSSTLPLFNEFSSNPKSEPESSSEKSNILAVNNKAPFATGLYSDLNLNKIVNSSIMNFKQNASINNPANTFDSLMFDSKTRPTAPPLTSPAPAVLSSGNIVPSTSSGSFLGNISQIGGSSYQQPSASSAFNQLINETYHSSSNMNSLDETSNHSRSSHSKHHKEKRKNKEKHKHKDKHKHKHKSKDKEHSNSITLPTTEDPKRSPIKLKIRKPLLSSSTELTPLKLKINLKNKNVSQSESSNKKRKQ